MDVAETYATVPAVVVFAIAARIPMFVATAAVDAETARTRDPEVMPVPVSPRYKPRAVIAPLRFNAIAVPEVVELAFTRINPSVTAVEVNAPVANNEITPFVATALVVPEATRRTDPEVNPVPVFVKLKPTPVVVKAFMVKRATVPVVVEAAMFNDRPPVVPECVIFTPSPVPVAP